jgi:hypothetical protein
VCSTSNEQSVSGIVRVGLGADVAAVMRVFAGDVVPRKKPDPAIYLLAATELGVEPGRCVVIEDSNIGARAARAAGMRCIVTTSGCDGVACLSACVAAPGCCLVMRARRFACRARRAAPLAHSYTGEEDFSTADAVFDCIGDKGKCCVHGGRAGMACAVMRVRTR